ncbi:hypothetical protein D3C71_1248990 [compost metagenome]
MRQSDLTSHDVAMIRLRVQGNAMRRPDQRVKNPVANPGPPDRKASDQLSARIGDHARMLAGAKASDNYDGYHKPGSMHR